MREYFSTDEVAAFAEWTFPGGYSASETAGQCWFDVDAAWTAVNAGPNLFGHVKGPLGGRPLIPAPWQAAWIANLFGWKRPDGLRRYRTTYQEVPRGNGKSTQCMVLVGNLLYIDDEHGADIFSAAGMRDQAKEVFGPFKANVLRNPHLERISKCYVNAVERIDPNTGNVLGTYKAISADADFQHGGSPYGVIFDELHVQPNRELWDVLQTGTVKRLQPLTAAISTAGTDPSSICGELHGYAELVRDGQVDDSTFLPVLYGAPIEADWKDPEVWRLANPNLGVSLTEEAISEQCKKAIANPSFEPAFRRLHLNQWVAVAVRYLPLDSWDSCREDFSEEDLEGQFCYGALDLASTRDVNSTALLFPRDDGFRVLVKYWVPEEAHDDNGRADRRQVMNWAARGLIKTTPGNTTDYEHIVADLISLSKRFRISKLAYDRWGPAPALIQRLQSEGFGGELLEYGQGYASMSAPMKEFLRLVLSKKLHHNGDPVLRWMVGNLVTDTDPAGNVKPNKAKSADKIDGCVATVMTLGLAMRYGTEEPKCWYVEGGLCV